LRIIWLRRPRARRLSEFVSVQAANDLSYAEVGATRGTLPPGYVHDHESIDIGPFDRAGFDRATAALRSWQVQRGAGIAVFPGDDVADGATFALLYRLPVGGYLTAAGRVTYVIDEPGRRFGFAYGTLPGHPERGEEAFTVAAQDDRMRFEITAFSRPRHPLARIAAPLTRILQRRATRGYLAAMRNAVGQPGT